MKPYPRTIEALTEIASGWQNEGVTAATRSWLQQSARAERVTLRQVKLLYEGSWASHGGYETGTAGARAAAREAIRELEKAPDARG